MDADSGDFGSGNKLPDDLTLDVLSRLPYKSFCRAKCTCTGWLSFSSNPHYCDKLPKPLTGFLYQKSDSSAVEVASLCPDDGSFDTSLSFLPRYEWLELMDSCNGLVLCKYGRNTSSPSVAHFVVCNPATRQWMELPETLLEPEGDSYATKLAFDPSWSPYFYVFNFEEKRNPVERWACISKVAIFSSRNSTWFMDDKWEPSNQISVDCQPHVLLGGKLFLQTSSCRVLVIDAFDNTEQPSHWIFDLPGYKPTSPMVDCLTGYLGHKSGVLHYVQPDTGGRTLLVWARDGYPHGHWNLKHRLSMSDAFGQNIFLDEHFDGFVSCHYDIVSLDLERGLVFLCHFAAERLLSYSLSTGKLTKIRDGLRRYLYYVPNCSMFPAKETDKDQDVSEP